MCTYAPPKKNKIKKLQLLSTIKLNAVAHNYMKITWHCSLHNPPLQLSVVLFIKSMQRTFMDHMMGDVLGGGRTVVLGLMKKGADIFNLITAFIFLFYF